MGIEYKIKFAVPENFSPAAMRIELPSPVASESATKIFSYALEQDGFYFVDHLVNREVAAVALRLLIDEALVHSTVIQVLEP